MADIQWEDVWRRLDWDRQERRYADQILTQRTAKYAHPVEEGAPLDQATLSALVFIRAGERYALPVAHVLRGAAPVHVTPLPGVPPYYRGVISLRGRILSVLDLPRLWGLPVDRDPPTLRLIVIQAARLMLALLADDILEIVQIPLSAIVPPLAAGIGLAHVQGLNPDGTIIVDVASLAADPRLNVHDEL